MARYMGIKNAINSFIKDIIGSKVDQAPIFDDQIIKTYISPASNEWNKIAISLVYENEKIPSQRNKIVCYPVIGSTGEVGLDNKMSTNDWNNLALKLHVE
ncbi:MAG: hypothetical protein AB2552_19175 [Candidatus Thiodiazotropha endolucinida]